MNLRQILMIVLACFIYAGSSIFSKLAANAFGVSAQFVGLLMGVILCLGLYAVLWQKILAAVPLGVAYLSKSLTIVLVLLCSCLVFGEVITLNNILGTGLILLGLINLYAPRR